MKIAAVGSALIALWQATEWFVTPSLTNSPEPLWMVLWGVALIGFAAAARDDARRRAARRNDAEAPAAWTAVAGHEDSCGAGMLKTVEPRR